MSSIAINSDVAEGFGAWSFGADEELLEHITAANVACGFHAGDPATIRSITDRAVRGGVAIGAQVSYRDLAGFGRRFIDADAETLWADLVYQIGALEVFARVAGGAVTYAKAHGALYNTAARHEVHAQALVDAVAATGPDRPILCQPGTEVWTRAERAGLTPICEVFADRAYTDEGLLAKRGTPGSLVTDADEIVERSLRMVQEGTVRTVSGASFAFPVAPGSVCIHSDTPGAGASAAALSTAFREAGIELVGIGGPR
ncbi:5-oxoprolinase subunit PxpA [Leucobacter japonicus]|uniref:5-oxoprolinase subunit PxpA n=1 Tax=Leucobacter japonicus TaxID=1461259 RepID=UPI0006A7DC02|nr:5-oxoprolinase subunit PxpA [Leucobacter japonicus]